MRLWECPRCERRGIKAEGFQFCVRCRDKKQGIPRRYKKAETDPLPDPEQHREGRERFFKTMEELGLKD